MISCGYGALKPIAAIMIAAAFVFGTTGIALSQDAVTVVYMVRHAEKQKPKDGEEPLADPGLSSEGEQRALDLWTILKDANLKAIYVSRFKRTQDTAKPTETKTGLKAKALPTHAIVKDILDDHVGDNVLVVGHSNTVDDIAAGLGVKDVEELTEDQYDRLFVITRKNDKSSLEIRKYGQPSPESRAL